MTVLALDLGTATGWAMLDPLDPLVFTSGTAFFKPSRFEGGGMRYLRFSNWLSDKAAEKPIGCIYYEAVRRHTATDAAHVYGGLMGTLTAWAELRGVPYQGIPVGTIKKHATGKGNASKQAVIDAMRTKGHDPFDDNEADALALLHWAIEAAPIS